MFKILVVDDENLIRYCLSATFREPSIAVRTAGSGKEALLALREAVFNVCILDLHLPDMNGMDILQLIRSTAPDTKIIIISGESLSREARKIVEENAVVYFDKPFDLDEVRSVVNLIRDQSLGAGAWSRESSAATERRRHIRTVADASISYSAVTPSGEARATDREAKLRDVSETGVQLFTAHRLEPGWWLTLSDGAQMNKGVVRWIRAAHETEAFHIGVQLSRPVA